MANTVYRNSVLRIAASEIQLDKEGVLHIKVPENRTISRKDMKVLTVAIGYLSSGKPKPILFHLAQGAKISVGASRVLLKSGTCYHIKALAFVSASFAHHIKLTLALLREKPLAPVKVFREADLAKNWIEDRVKQAIGVHSARYALTTARSAPTSVASYSIRF